ncbi:hypothetical protein HPB52_000084 [Rhipicephalus sanguineus]|uniref:CCHC-type domain-containing protein n=1 Tax=Rhipicephalus sanguineus TaxID=34632 RepID=A0A9D4SX11_RHISA|nr:hypothetical protein HPB52_000084 [Rhipicephalus sanguineus]
MVGMQISTTEDTWINHRRNTVAVDMSTLTCLSELLTIKELNSVAVTAREPDVQRASVGFLHGTNGEPTDSELLKGISLSVMVLSASREGRTVKLWFASSVPRKRVSLYDLQLQVQHARQWPLQCRLCGRFGHVAEACQHVGNCIRCG